MGPTLRGTGGPRLSPPSGPRFRPSVWPSAPVVGERMSLNISDLQTIDFRGGGVGGVRRKRLRCQGEGRATPLRPVAGDPAPCRRLAGRGRSPLALTSVGVRTWRPLNHGFSTRTRQPDVDRHAPNRKGV
jgi:hypothetical protein